MGSIIRTVTTVPAGMVTCYAALFFDVLTGAAPAIMSCLITRCTPAHYLAIRSPADFSSRVLTAPERASIPTKVSWSKNYAAQRFRWIRTAHNRVWFACRFSGGCGRLCTVLVQTTVPRGATRVAEV
jgi:hypothetical protein